VRVLGIDPGSTGALCFLTIVDGLPVALECLDIPTQMIGKRSHLDAYSLAREIDARLTVAGEPLAAAIIEQGGVRPQNGRVGAATFWMGLGIVRGVLAANFIPTETVTAAGWKQALRVTGDKDASRVRASAIFPKWSDQWSRVKDHGRAEAALIALHGANRLPVRQVQQSA
jgi:crossover junction endodeoxyribonuclease RuvC